MDRVVSLARGKRRIGTLDGPPGGSRSGPFRPAYRPRGGHPTAPWNWPCKSRADAKCRGELPGRTSRVGGLLRECRRRQNGPPWRRSNFPRAGTSNTPPALPWRSSGDSSRSEALAGDLEKRFPEDTFVKFTYVPVLRALAALGGASPRTASSGWKSRVRMSSRRMASTFNGYYLGGLHSAYVRGQAFGCGARYAEAGGRVSEDPRSSWSCGLGSHRRTGALATRESVRLVGRQGQGEGCL